MKVPSHCVIATFQLYGSLMLESPDYFLRVREIGRLRQTSTQIDEKETNVFACMNTKLKLTGETEEQFYILYFESLSQSVLKLQNFL